MSNNLKYGIDYPNGNVRITAHLMNTSYDWSVKFTDSLNIASKKDETLIYIFSLSRLSYIFNNEDNNIHVDYPQYINTSSGIPEKLKIKLMLYSEKNDCYDKIRIVLTRTN